MIHIQLQCHTVWGENVQLRIGRRHIPMDYSFDGHWQIMLDGRELKNGGCFTFEVVRDGKLIRREWRKH